jgi:Thiol-disulfide isomerase and thioredoxins
MRRILASVTAIALALGLGACSSTDDDLVDQYQQGGAAGFSMQEIPVADRGAALSFEGTNVDGDAVSSDDYAGEVLVLNFWYAGCGPCRAEAPILQQVAEETAADGASFLGVNVYDGAEQATAFEKTYGVSYPSLLAVQDAELKLAFADWTSVQATPTTLVIDHQGRVAARFIGQVKSASILKTVVNDVLAEAP